MKALSDHLTTADAVRGPSSGKPWAAAAASTAVIFPARARYYRCCPGAVLCARGEAKTPGGAGDVRLVVRFNRRYTRQRLLPWKKTRPGGPKLWWPKTAAVVPRAFPLVRTGDPSSAGHERDAVDTWREACGLADVMRLEFYKRVVPRYGREEPRYAHGLTRAARRSRLPSRVWIPVSRLPGAERPQRTGPLCLSSSQQEAV